MLKFRGQCICRGQCMQHWKTRDKLGRKGKCMGEKRESYECKLHKCRMKLNVLLESHPKSDAITFACPTRTLIFGCAVDEQLFCIYKFNSSKHIACALYDFQCWFGWQPGKHSLSKESQFFLLSCSVTFQCFLNLQAFSLGILSCHIRSN